MLQLIFLIIFMSIFSISVSISSSILGPLGYFIYKKVKGVGNFLKNPLSVIPNPLDAILKEPAEIGEPCVAHTDCKDWGPGPHNIACCKGVCSKKKTDYLGISWCPHECKKGLFAKHGSC